MKNHDKILLLSKNPKALQFLHVAAGFDFQAPHTVTRLCGRFTARTVVQEIPAGHVAALLLEVSKEHRYSYWKHQLIYTRVKGYTFDADRARGVNYWDYSVDYVSTKKDFEEIRKNGTAQIWIVTQDPAHIIAPNRGPVAPDEHTRYSVGRCTQAADGRGNTWYSAATVSRLGYNGKPAEIRAQGRPASMADFIDKSGYNVDQARAALRCRVAAYKRGKNAAAVLAYDFSGDYTAAVEKLEAARAALIVRAQTAKSAEDWEAVEKSAFYLERGASWLEHYNKKAQGNALSSVFNGLSLLKTVAEYAEKAVNIK